MKRIITLFLAVLMLLAVSAPVLALDSPEALKYDINCVSIDNKRGTVIQTVNTDGTVTFTASPVSNAFTEWDITGEYEIVSGGLKDKSITIRPLSDIKAVAHFDGKLIESPETGTSGIAVISLLALASFAAMAYAGKRIRD